MLANPTAIMAGQGRKLAISNSETEDPPAHLQQGSPHQQGLTEDLAPVSPAQNVHPLLRPGRA